MDEGKPGWVQDQRDYWSLRSVHMYVHKKGGSKSRTSLRQEAGNRVGGNGNREGRKEGGKERERERGMEPPFVCWQSRRQRQ